MTTFQNYKTITKPSVLILGPPGTGKTTIMAMCGRIHIVELDNNIDGPFRYIAANKLMSQASFDIPLLDKDQKPVIWSKQWQAIKDSIINTCAADPTIEAIGLDSMTALVDCAMNEVRNIQKKKEDALIEGWNDWTLFVSLMRQFVTKLKLHGKTVVVAAHVTYREDKITDTLMTFIKCPSQFRDEIAGLFSECWLTCIDERIESGKARYVRTIKTVPGPRQAPLGLKTSLGLPDKMDLDLTKVRDLILKAAAFEAPKPFVARSS